MNKGDILQDIKHIDLKMYVGNNCHKWKLSLPANEIPVLIHQIDNFIYQLDSISDYKVVTINR